MSVLGRLTRSWSLTPIKAHSRSPPPIQSQLPFISYYYARLPFSIPLVTTTIMPVKAVTTLEEFKKIVCNLALARGNQ